MEATITLKEVLDHLDNGQECDLVVVTCNTTAGTGGELLLCKNVRKHNWTHPDELKRQKKVQPSSVQKLKRDPRHYENSTRNIVFPGGAIRKIHIRLIRKFNNKKVL